MIQLTAAEVAETVSGRLRGVPAPGDVIVDAADTDSRNIGEGALFIAKPGEMTDGHRFIDSALAAGARLALTERETQHGRGPHAGEPHPAVIVDDVVEAMGRLAAEVIRRIRAHSPTTVIGITGSAGKTTTKDLLTALLGAEGPTTAPQGSYNGEVGVPLTIFTAALETRYLVMEMGADAPGNIAELCRMVRPDIGVVLTVGSAHAEKFGGSARIAQTKGELAEAVGPEGRVILNADDPQVAAMAERSRAPITWFAAAGRGIRGAQRVEAHDVELTSEGHPTFGLTFAEGPDVSTGSTDSSHLVTSGLIGAHHLTNLLAAAAAAQAAGLDPAAIACRLDGLGPASRWRMERTEVPVAGSETGITLINDAYNANPESMREALLTVMNIARPGGGRPDRRYIAVLGAMLELGEEHVTAHTRIGELVVRLNVDLTVVVGEEAYVLYRGLVGEGSWGSEVHWFATAEEAEEFLDRQLRAGDLVLFKSSNAAGLRLLGDRIAERKAGAQWWE